MINTAARPSTSVLNLHMNPAAQLPVQQSPLQPYHVAQQGRVVRESDHDPSSSHNEDGCDELTDLLAAGRPPVLVPGPHDVVLGTAERNALPPSQTSNARTNGLLTNCDT
jgi:hypothetical protein